MVGFAGDGNPTMIRKSNGAAAKLKKKLKEFERTTFFFSLHLIHHQEALFAKSLKINHVINNDVKTMNFISASVLNYREFVTLLWETVNGYGEIFYHSL
jgi:hypothetical protein